MLLDFKLALIRLVQAFNFGAVLLTHLLECGLVVTSHFLDRLLVLRLHLLLLLKQLVSFFGMLLAQVFDLLFEFSDALLELIHDELFVAGGGAAQLIKHLLISVLHRGKFFLHLVVQLSLHLLVVLG